MNYGDEFILRAKEAGLKGRAVKCSRRRNMKLSPWIEEAIREKAEREERAEKASAPEEERQPLT